MNILCLAISTFAQINKLNELQILKMGDENGYHIQFQPNRAYVSLLQYYRSKVSFLTYYYFQPS